MLAAKGRVLRLAIALAGVSLVPSFAHAGEIIIEYVPPKNPEHEPIYANLKRIEALERLRDIYSPFQLPQNLKLQTIGCDGQVNAWYHNGIISVCYEYLAESRKRMPVKSPMAASDALIGQFFYVFAHEMGHAIFDNFSVPVFGHAEDAADLFAAYVMLQFNKEDARRLVMGSAYTFKEGVMNTDAEALLKAYSDAHGTPEQRLFNLLCMAYGADRDTFGVLVERGFLPERRAMGCRREYGEVKYAFLKLISPHIDQAKAKAVMEKEWLPREAIIQPASGK